jgi:class 3 adenylate cyclase/tetratricopeptide (TPR) repeat protein
MPVCPRCGRENVDDARFCSGCGSELAIAEPQRESRKVVTVLFCDLVGSTALGESTDPEALRVRMRRYFADLRAILERHGGSVEKFVGDAVMAVFGIPVAHEDDALRAVRAAWEMREAVSAHGLAARIGVNTGEVVVGGEGETLVTGDAVNVAARLEQSAPSGEVLLGNETRLLVRDAVRVEPVEPLTLKGKSRPVAAFRLLEVIAGAEPVARDLESVLVGRERERARLRREFEDTVADRACRLVTLLGPAGVGKSRLVADFLERAREEADVLHGRCLNYGEGITYWPLVELLLAIGVEPETVLGSSAAETQLAFRRLLEERAAARPQIVVFDDIHWAERTFLELIEHIADLSRGAPIFLLSVARTELLDAQPGWGGGKLNATSLLLEPLAADDCERLIDALSVGAIDRETRRRIIVASEGNPLFLHEMLAMARERQDDDALVVPPTIHALLQARLDALPANERTVIECGSVEGQVFHRGSVAELAPPVRPDVEAYLSALVRQELIRPDSTVFADDEAFRFRHILIRDAAYESLPKATRAQLHEHFASWLEGQELVERDEIVGYHLEQAHRYRRELDPKAAQLPHLAERTAAHLAAAGRAALDRGDARAARTLLERAAAVLPPDDEGRLALAPELADAYFETANRRAVEVLTHARSADNPSTRARAALRLGTFGLDVSNELVREQRVALLEEARAVFESEGDDLGLAEYWRAEAEERWTSCRAAETAEACERGLIHLERAGAAYGYVDRRTRQLLLRTLIFSPIPVDEALARVRELSRDDDGPLIRAAEHAVTGTLLSMRGELDRALELVRGARRVFADAGHPVLAGSHAISEGTIEIRAGAWEQAETTLREGLADLEGRGENTYSSTLAAMLAIVLVSMRELGAAREALIQARRATASDDLINFVFTGFAEGLTLAHERRFAEAELAGRGAVALADRIDFCFGRPLAHSYFAETLALVGKPEEAAGHAATALGILEGKGDVMLAARVRERLTAVGVQTPERAVQ